MCCGVDTLKGTIDLSVRDRGGGGRVGPMQKEKILATENQGKKFEQPLAT